MRRLKKTTAEVQNVEVTTLPQRIALSGEIKEKIIYIEKNNLVKDIEGILSFNHTFPAMMVKKDWPAIGEIEIEHITSTLLNGGKKVAIDYLLIITITVEGQGKKIKERFLIHHVCDLPSFNSKIKVVPKIPTSKKVTPEDLDEKISLLENRLQDKLTDIIEHRLQAKGESLKQELRAEKEKNKLAEIKEKQMQFEQRKRNIIRESNRQELQGYSTRHNKSKGG